MVRTYADLLDHVARVVWGHGLSASRDMIRTAIGSAYSSLPLLSAWRRYQAVQRLYVAKPQNGLATLTGTTLELTDSSWPTWASGSTIILQGQYCRVATRDSDTELTLGTLPDTSSEGNIPYTLTNDLHRLPDDFLNVRSVYIPHYNIPLAPSSFTDAVNRWGLLGGVAVPTCYWIEHCGSAKYLRVLPPPGSDLRLDVHYQRMPSQLQYTGRDQRDSGGTVSVNGVNVTGTGTSFVPEMVGCVIRIGDGTNPPTGPEGLAPYRAERSIVSVTDATHLKVDRAFSDTYSSVMYSITDVLDIDEYLYQVLVSQSLFHLGSMLGRPIDENSREALRTALAADAVQLGAMPLGQPPVPAVTGRMILTS